MVSLLTRPSVSLAEKNAYEIIYPGAQIVCVIKKDDGDNFDIDDKLDDIFENSVNIKQLIKQRESVVGRIQTKMDLLAYENIELTGPQVESFVSFCNYYQEGSMKLNQNIEYIECQSEISEVKKELFKIDTNLNFVYKKLKEFIEIQLRTISLLKDFVSIALNTLATI
ncbi:MAG: hypothetical protein LBV08_01945 [Clostridiales bacterium]|nr:hypothetical protein [Clostridiales bacterium]